MYKKLADITTKIGSGSTPKGGEKVYKTQGISFIRSQNVLDFYFSKKNLFFIDEQQAESLNNVMIEKGDILLNITGNSVARCCIVPDEILPARVNQHVAIIRSLDKKNNYFLMYYLQFMKPHLLTICKIGGTRKALTKEMLENLPIIANENLQQAGYTLAKLDKKIFINNSTISKLEEMAKTIYEYWFLQFDFPNSEGKPYASSGGAMKYSEELGREIPIDWEILNLWEQFDFEKGIEIGAKQYLSESGKNRVLFWRVGDMNGTCSTYADKKLFGELLLQPRDICVSFDGSVGKVDFGLVGGYSSGIRKIYDRLKKIDSSVIYQIFKSDYIQQLIHKYATGSNILHASGSITNMRIPYNEKVFEEYQKIIKPMFDKMVQAKQENQKLAQLRDWLLPMLMNGQARVE